MFKDILWSIQDMGWKNLVVVLTMGVFELSFIGFIVWMILK